MLKQIHHKKNEKQEVESFKDKECTEAFDFTNAKNLYIELVNADVTPLTKFNAYDFNIFTPYLAKGNTFLPRSVETLDDITPNLSKYIPEDNAVLFLTQNDFDSLRGDLEPSGLFIWEKRDGLTHDCIKKCSKMTIFTKNGTQSEFKKANEVGKYLWENFGIKPNFFVLHCFLQYIDASNVQYTADLGLINKWSINKIITTNSTGILPVQDKERLQVIDCKEIFEEYLKNQ